MQLTMMMSVMILRGQLLGDFLFYIICILLSVFDEILRESKCCRLWQSRLTYYTDIYSVVCVHFLHHVLRVDYSNIVESSIKI